MGKQHAKVLSLFELPEMFPTERKAVACLERLRRGNVKRDTADRLDSLFGGMAGKTVACEELTR